MDDGIAGTGVVGPTTPSRCRYLDRIRAEEEDDEQVESDIVDFVSADEEHLASCWTTDVGDAVKPLEAGKTGNILRRRRSHIVRFVSDLDVGWRCSPTEQTDADE